MSLRNHTDIGINEPRFLFVLDVMVLNLLDEGRRAYSLCRICILSLMILVALRCTRFSYKTVRVDCFKPVTLLLMFALQIIIVFLIDVLKPTDKKTYKKIDKHG